MKVHKIAFLLSIYLSCSSTTMASENKPTLFDLVWLDVPGGGLEVSAGMEDNSHLISKSMIFSGKFSLYYKNFGISPSFSGSIGSTRNSAIIGNYSIPTNRNATKSEAAIHSSLALPIKIIFIEPFIGIGTESYFINLVEGKREGFDSENMMLYIAGCSFAIPMNVEKDGFLGPMLNISFVRNQSSKHNKQFSGDKINVSISYALKAWMLYGK